MHHEEPVRLALIGAGEMASVHATNACNAPSMVLTYAYDPDQDRLRQLCDKTGAKPVSEDTIFENIDIDAYIIASPPFTHADYIEKAIARGKYAFCEKPIDHDFDRINGFVERIGEGKHKVQLGFNRRFDPDFVALKSALDNKDIGAIEQVVITSRDHQAPTIEMLANSSGMLRETSIHDFDTAHWLMAEDFVSIYVLGAALVNSKYSAHGHIDTATSVLTTASGKQVTIINSWRATYAYDQRIEILGSKGMISARNVPTNNIVHSNSDGIIGANPPFSYWDRYKAAYRLELEAFVRSVRGGLATSPDAADGQYASFIAEHAVRSLIDGQKIAIPCGQLNCSG